MAEEENSKRLIPIMVSSCGKNKYSVKVDENEPYEVEADEDSMRRALLRIKAKNGDGEKNKRSSKNGTYKSMIDGQSYVWKSKCPNTVDDFKALLESQIKLTKNYILEGTFCPKGTLIELEDN